MQIKIRAILSSVLHAVTASTDFHPHEGRDPEVWDNYVPSWKIRHFECSQYVDDSGKDLVMIKLSWTATLLFPNGWTREVSTTYVFESEFFDEHYGISGLIMHFHDHVAKALQLSIIPKE